MEFIEEQLGPLLAAAREMPDSVARFEDGGHYRVEIPSVESVAAFESVLEEAQRLGVPVHRVSQGSGIHLMLDEEIAAYAKLGAENHVEVCLFVGPRAPWDGVASALTPDGKFVGWRHARIAHVEYAFRDVLRAVRLGIRSVLIADEGLATLIEAARTAGALPADLVVKGSAMMGISNPLGARVLQNIGVDTLNVASDSPIGELAAFRAACTAPLDLYIESPDSLGGFTRYHELAEIVRVAAPVHLKFGLKNAASLYPTGGHLDPVAIATGRERVRRAAIGMETLARNGTGARPSPTGMARPGVPSIQEPERS